MDTDNPAVASQILLPPAMLEELATNSDKSQEFAGKLGWVNIMQINKLMRDPNTPLKLRMDWAQFLINLSKLPPQKNAVVANAGGPAFVLNINLSGKKDTGNQVIEVQPTEVEEQDE